MHKTYSDRIFSTNAPKGPWLAIVFCTFLYGAMAQTWNLKAPDSLLNAVRTSKGTEKVDALNHLSKQTIFFSNQEAVPIVKEALQLAETLHYHKGEANAIENIASLAFGSSDFHEAINLMNKAASIYKRYNYVEAFIECLIVEAAYFEYINDNGKIIDTYQQAIDVSKDNGRLDLESKAESYFVQYFLSIGDKANAKAYLSKSMTISKKANSNAALGHTYLAMALYFRSDNQYQKAIKYSKMMLTKPPFNEMQNKASVYSRMGGFFMDSNQNDSAFVYYHKALKFGVLCNDAGILATTFTRMAHLFQKEQQLDSALKYQKIALNVRRSHGIILLIGSSLSNIGTVYAQKHDYPQALSYYNQGLVIAKQSGYLNYIQFNYKCLYDLYLAQKNYKKSIYYNQLLSALNDSILNIQTRLKFNRIQDIYKSEQKQQAIEFLTKENDLQKLKINQTRYMTYVMVTLLILLFAIGVFLNIQAKLKVRHRQTDSERKLLRSQMNPQFIFNALISIQDFINNNESDEAAKYLTRFARLIRLVLTNSREESITLQREIDMLENYMALQKMRFKNKFDYTFIVDPNLDPEFINVPPMMTQPFLESAIELGIQGMSKPGYIEISILEREQNILIQVVDNGIMRKENQTQQAFPGEAIKSDALLITTERIRYLNHKHALKITFSINEFKDEHNQFAGTKALLVIPEMRLMPDSKRR